MDSQQINIELNNIRSVRSANVILDGVSVVAGENGCGKSTISKLTYFLFKTSIEFDEMVNEQFQKELSIYYNVIDYLFSDLIGFMDQKNAAMARKYFKRFSQDRDIVAAIEFLRLLFKEIEISDADAHFTGRLQRICKVLADTIGVSNQELNFENNQADLIVELLKKLEIDLERRFSKIEIKKENRPLSILNSKLEDAFYDAPLDGDFNFFEYNVPIIDKENGKLLSMHSIDKVAYIDTPMILGLENMQDRPHWNDLNKLLQNPKSNGSNPVLGSIFEKEIIQGNVRYEDDMLSSNSFTYKRNDGNEFNLLECATGLKSFSVLQLLYKNGFLTNKTLLIIDEPEVHLHPQWVVEYARLIVLLNKHLGVKFLLASHNPDMISAIKYISKKENNSKNLHFYLAKQYENSFTYDYSDLGIEIDEIFSSFNLAFERIDLYGQAE